MNFECKHCKHCKHVCIPRLLVSEPLIVSTIPSNIGQHHNKHEEVLYSLILSFSYKVSAFSRFFYPFLLSFYLQARKAHTRLPSVNQPSFHLLQWLATTHSSHITSHSSLLPNSFITSSNLLSRHLFSPTLSSQWHQPSAHSLVSSSRPSPTKGSKIN